MRRFAGGVLATCFATLVLADSNTDSDGFIIPDGVYSAQFIEELDGIAVIEFSGDYNRRLADGSTNAAARAVVAQEFYSNYPDNYDFLVVFSDFDFDTGGAAAFHVGVSNKVEGIGLPQYSNAELFGSNGALQGYIDMASLDRYSSNPLSVRNTATNGTFDSALKILAHETLHQWASHTLIEDFQGRDDSHWNFFMNTDGSIMYGHDWRDNNDGTFTAEGARSKFSDLDLYLMGLLPATDVADTFVIEPANDDYSEDDLPAPGITVEGTRKNYSIQDFISAHGERTPSVDESEKIFKYGFIYLTLAGQTAPNAQIQKLKTITDAYQERFSILTGGRAVAQVSSPTASIVNAGAPEFVETNGGDNPGGVDIPRAIQWLNSQRLQLGQWQDKPATEVRDTQVALTVLSQQDSSFRIGSSVLQWLQSKSEDNTDSLSRVLGFLPNSPQLLTILTRRQNNDGGWGLDPVFGSSVQDSALALCAVVKSNVQATPSAVTKAIRYLENQQNSDGGWGIVTGATSSISVTSQVLQALHCADSRSPSVNQALNWLTTQGNTDHGFGDESSSVHETAQVMKTLLLYAATERIEFDLAAAYIADRQSNTGDWSGSVYTTALALDAIQSSRFPNLKVISFTEVPSPIRDGSFVQISAVVENDSSDSVPASVARFYLGDPASGGIEIGTVSIPVLPPFAQTSVTIYWNTFDRAGPQTIVVRVDDDDEIVERTESDNQLAYSLTIAPPETGVELLVNESEFLVEPDTVAVLPTQIDYAATVRNIGDTDADNVLVELWREANPDSSDSTRELIGSQRVSVSSRSSAGVNFASTQTIPGRSVVTLIIDADDRFSELDESNNRASAEINSIDGVDFEVNSTDISITSPNVFVNSYTNFAVNIRNRGTSSSPNAEIVFGIRNTLGETILQTLEIALEPGEERSFTQEWLVDQAGDATFFVQIDAQNLIAEIDEDNNTAESVFSADLAEGSNLAVHFSELEFNPAVGLEGMDVSLNAIIRNSGTNPIDVVAVGFYDGNPADGGQLIETTTLENLESADSATASVIWRQIPDAATRFIYVVVDADNAIAELNETDNIAFKKFDVLSLPDMAVSTESIQSTPKFPRIGETAEFLVSITNTGKQAVSSVPVFAYHGADASGNLIAQTEVDLAGATSIDWVFDYTFEEFGDQTVFVIVDPENTIVEAVESNNSASKTFLIQDGDFYLSDLYLSPDDNGIKDSITYYFNLAEPEVVTVEVRDKYQRVAAQLNVSDQAVQSESVSWNGRNEFGGVVIDGRYTIAVKTGAGIYLGERVITVDTNRSPLSEAINTPYELNRNLTCRVGEIDKIYDNASSYFSDNDLDIADTQNVLYGPNDQFIYFATFFPPVVNDDGSTIRTDDKVLFPSGIYRASNNGTDVAQIMSGDEIAIDKIRGVSISENGDKIFIEEQLPTNNMFRLWSLDSDGQDARSFDISASVFEGIHDIQTASANEFVYRTGREIFKVADDENNVPELLLNTSEVYTSLGLTPRNISSMRVSASGQHALIELPRNATYQTGIDLSYELLRRPSDYVLVILDLATGEYRILSEYVSSHEWNHLTTAFAIAEPDAGAISIYDQDGTLLSQIDLMSLQDSQLTSEERGLIDRHIARFVDLSGTQGLLGRIEEIDWSPDNSELAFVFEDYLASISISNGCYQEFEGGNRTSPGENSRAYAFATEFLQLIIPSAHAGIAIPVPGSDGDCNDFSDELKRILTRYVTADGIYIASLSDGTFKQVAVTSTLEASFEGFGGVPEKRSPSEPREKAVISPTSNEPTFGRNRHGFALTRKNLPYIPWTGQDWLSSKDGRSLRTLHWLSGARELLITNGDASYEVERYAQDDSFNRFDDDELSEVDRPFNNTVLLNLDNPAEETREAFSDRDLITFESFKTKRGVYPSPTGKFLTYFSDDEFDQCASNQERNGYRQFQSLHNLTADLRAIKSPEFGGFLLEGSAVDKHFATYRLEYADVDSPKIWNLVTPPSDQPVIDDRFTNWVPPYIGRFYVRLTVNDLAGNQRQEIVQISNVEKPSISGVFLSHAYFSPNGDGAQDETDLNFRVLEPVNLTVDIYDENEQLVRSIVESYDVIGSEQTISWNGRDNSGVLLADGKYRIAVQRYEFVTTLDNTVPVIADTSGPLFIPQSVSPKDFPCEFPNGISSEALYEQVDRYCRVSLDTKYGGTLIESNLLSFVIQRKAPSESMWSDIAGDEVLRLIDGDLHFATDSQAIDDIRRYRYRYVVTDLAGNKTILLAPDSKLDKVHMMAYQPLGERRTNNFGFAQFLSGAASGNYRATWLDTPEQFNISVTHSATANIEFVELLYRDADLDIEFESISVIPDSGTPVSIVSGIADFNFVLDKSLFTEVQADRYEVQLRLRLANGQILESDKVVIADKWIWETVQILLDRNGQQSLFPRSPKLLPPREREVQFSTNVPVADIDKVVVFLKSSGPLEDPRYAENDEYIATTDTLLPDGSIRAIERPYNTFGRIISEDIDAQFFEGRTSNEQVHSFVDPEDNLKLINDCGYGYTLTALLFHHNSVVALASGYVEQGKCIDLVLDVDPVLANACGDGPSNAIDIAAVPQISSKFAGQQIADPLTIQIGTPLEEDQIQDVLIALNLPKLVSSAKALNDEQLQQYTQRINTSSLPEGPLPLRAVLSLEDGSRIVKDFVVPIVHTVPSVDISYPLPDQQVCAIEYVDPLDPESSIDLGIEIQGQITSAGPDMLSVLGSSSHTASFNEVSIIDSPARNLLGALRAENPTGTVFLDRTRVRDSSVVRPSKVLSRNNGSAVIASGVLAVPLVNGSGTYDYDFEVTNWSGAKLCKTVSVNVDAEIDSLTTEVLGGVSSNVGPATVRFFSPNSDDHFDELQLRYSVAEAMRVDIEVFIADASDPDEIVATDTVVKKFPTQQVAEGNHQTAWNGTDDADDTLNDGLYIIEFNFEDGCGNREQITRIVGVDTTPPQLAINYPLDGDNVPLQIRVQGLVLDQLPGSYQLSVGNNGADFSLLKRGAGNVEGELGIWNSFGYQGTWTFLLEAEDKVGNQSQLNHSLTIPVRENLISSLETTDYFVSPNADGRLDSLIIRAGFDIDLLATFTIRDADNNPIRQLTNRAAFSQGYANLTWDGKTDAGDTATDGVYSVELVVEGNGNVQTENVIFELDNTPPQADLYQLNNGYIELAGAAQITGSVADRNFLDFTMTLSTSPSAINPLPDPLQIGFSSSQSSQTIAYVPESLFEFEQEYLTELQVQDKAGNRTVLSHPMVIDLSPPRVLIEQPVSGDVVNSEASPLTILGRVDDTFLKQYDVFLALASDPETRTQIRRGDGPVTGELATWDVSGLADGEYLLSVEAQDRGGLTGEAQVSVIVDNTPPTVEITQPSEFAYLTEIQAVIGSANDSNFERYTLAIAAGQSDQQSSFTELSISNTAVLSGTLFGWSELPDDGTYTLRLAARDLAGNEAEVFRPFVIDTRPPAAPELLSVEITDVRTTAQIEWLANSESDLAGYNLYRNGGKINVDLLSDITYEHLDLPEGEHRYTVTAVDQAGQESDPSNELMIVVDTTPPETLIASPADGTRVNLIVDILGTAFSQDDFEIYRVFVGPDESNLVKIYESTLPVQGGLLSEWDTLTELDGADYIIRLETEDRYGNHGLDQVSVTIDNTATGAPINLTAEVQDIDDALISWESPLNADDLFGYLLYRNGRLITANEPVVGDLKPYALTGTSYLDQDLPDGDYEYVVYAIDQAGNISDPSNTDRVALDNRAPQALITNVTSGQAFIDELALLAETPDNDVAQVALQYRATGDTAWIELALPTERPYDYLWDTSALDYGDYQIRAVATDVGGKTDPEPGIKSVSKRDTVAPAIVVDLAVHVNSNTGTISWRAGDELDLAGYHLYTAQCSSCTYNRLSSELITATSFNHQVNVYDVLYYKVSAVDDSGNENELSDFEFGVYALTETNLSPLVSQNGEVDVLVSLDNVYFDYEKAAVSHESPDGQVEDFMVERLPTDSLKVSQRLSLTQMGVHAFTSQIESSEYRFIAEASAASTVIVSGKPSTPTGVATSLDQSGVDDDVVINWNPNPAAERVIGYKIYRNGSPLDEDELISDVTAYSNRGGSVNNFLPTSSASSYWSVSGSTGVRFGQSWDKPRLVRQIELDWQSFRYVGRELEIYALIDGVMRKIDQPFRSSSTRRVISLPMPVPTTQIEVRVTEWYSSFYGGRLNQMRIFADELSDDIEFYRDQPGDGEHEYQLQAVNVFGGVSDLSEPETEAVGDTTPPAPVVLSVAVEQSTAMLTWQADDDALNFDVYLDGQYFASTTDRAYSVDELANGTYQFHVTAADAVGNESEPSNTVEATINIQLLTAPVNLQAVAVPALSGIELNWSAFDDEAPYGYNIFRSQVNGAEFELIDEWLEDSVYFDAEVETGVRYFYVVTAVDELGNASAQSNQADAELEAIVKYATPEISLPTDSSEIYRSMRSEGSIGGLAQPGSDVFLIHQETVAGDSVTAAAAAAEFSYPSRPNSRFESGLIVGNRIAMATWYDFNAGRYIATRYREQDGSGRWQNIDSLAVMDQSFGPRNLADLGDGRVIIDDRTSRPAYLYSTITNEVTPLQVNVALNTSLRQIISYSEQNNTMVAYARVDGTLATYSFDLSTQQATRLPNHFEYRVSPDGRYVAYTPSASSPSTIVYVLDLVTEQTTSIDLGETPRNNVFGNNNIWSPDSSRLLLVKESGPEYIPTLHVFEHASGTSIKVDSDVSIPGLAASRLFEVVDALWQSNNTVLYTAREFDSYSLYLLEYDVNAMQTRVLDSITETGSGALELVGANSAGSLLFAVDSQLESLMNYQLPGYFVFNKVSFDPGENSFSAVSVDEQLSTSDLADPITVIYQASDLPDYQLEVTLNPQLPLADHSTSIKVGVSNAGQAVADAANVSIRVLDSSGTLQTLFEQIVGPVQPTSELELEVSWTPLLSGNHTLIVDIDKANVVAESVESNNTRIISVDVAATASPQVKVSLMPSPSGTSEFAANQTVQGVVNVINAGDTFTGTLIIDVIDVSGNPVDVVREQPVTDLAYGATLSLDFAWNTQTTLTGTYKLRARLVDTGLESVNDDTAEFGIIDQLVMQLGVRSDQASYAASDIARITATMINDSINTLFEGGTLEIIIESQSGQRVYQSEVAVSNIFIADRVTQSFDWAVGPVAPGMFSVTATLYQEASVIASSNANIEVRGTPDLAGQLQLQDAELNRGQPLSFSGTLNNTGNIDLSDIVVTYQIVDDISVVASETQTVSQLAVGDDVSAQFSLPLTDQEVGRYRLVMSADSSLQSGTQLTKTLAEVRFAVIDSVAPTVEITQPEPGAIINSQRVQGQIAVSDDQGVASVSARFGDGGWREMKSSPLDGSLYTVDLSSLSEGPHEIVATAKDVNDNVSINVRRDFVVDNTAPQIDVLNIVEDQAFDQGVTPNVRVTDSHLTRWTASVNGSPWTPGNSITLSGEISLTINAYDAAGNASRLKVNFVINNVVLQPVELLARDDQLMLRRGVWGTVDVLANDQYENADALAIEIVEQPKNGSLVLASKGKYNYFPALSFLGEDRFSYRLTDSITGKSAVATVQVDVGPAASCAIVPDHTSQGSERVSLPGWAITDGDQFVTPKYRITILGNSNPDAFVANQQPQVSYPDCSLTYQPQPGKRVAVTVRYLVRDARTNGERYTSPVREFTLYLDARDRTKLIIVPILQLLLDEEPQ